MFEFQNASCNLIKFNCSAMFLGSKLPHCFLNILLTRSAQQCIAFLPGQLQSPVTCSFSSPGNGAEWQVKSPHPELQRLSFPNAVFRDTLDYLDVDCSQNIKPWKLASDMKQVLLHWHRLFISYVHISKKNLQYSWENMKVKTKTIE